MRICERFWDGVRFGKGGMGMKNVGAENVFNWLDGMLVEELAKLQGMRVTTGALSACKRRRKRIASLTPGDHKLSIITSI